MYFLYKMVCRSLFEKDKLLFFFLLCTRMMRASGKLAAALSGCWSFAASNRTSLCLLS